MKLSTVEEIINENKMVVVGQGSRKAALGFFPVGSPQYIALVKGVKPNAETEPVGVIVGERLTRHPESMSVSRGIFLTPTDTHAVERRHAVVARYIGQPVNVARICEPGKPVDNVVQMLGIGSAK